MRYRADHSIRYAAFLVLAACATKPLPPPDDPLEVGDEGDGGSGHAQGADVNTDPAHVESTIAVDVATLATDEDPTALCQAYQKKIAETADDPRTLPVPNRTTRSGMPRPGVEGWKAAEGKVQCHIVWATESVQMKVMITPTCCPMGMNDQPCPGPSPRMMTGAQTVEETVILDPASSDSERRIEWLSYQPPIARHACGRRPEGLSMTGAAREGVGGTLATMAALEAASVPAFERLARELASHGAPAELVERARRAMRDEVRHARALRRLARAYGGKPVKWRRAALPVRSRLELALENAVEGCVREAFGAAVALVQAARAANASVREAFRTIAEDECEHAALAWDVHAWFLQTAAPDERVLLEQAQRQAVATIDHDLTDERTRHALGLPDAAMSRELLAAMGAELGLAA
jgi:rubrerythrin